MRRVRACQTINKMAQLHNVTASLCSSSSNSSTAGAESGDDEQPCELAACINHTGSAPTPAFIAFTSTSSAPTDLAEQQVRTANSARLSFGAWSSWSACGVDCKQYRKRTCTRFVTSIAEEARADRDADDESELDEQQQQQQRCTSEGVEVQSSRVCTSTRQCRRRVFSVLNQVSSNRSESSSAPGVAMLPAHHRANWIEQPSGHSRSMVGIGSPLSLSSSSSVKSPSNAAGLLMTTIGVASLVGIVVAALLITLAVVLYVRHCSPTQSDKQQKNKKNKNKNKKEKKAPAALITTSVVDVDDQTNNIYYTCEKQLQLQLQMQQQQLQQQQKKTDKSTKKERRKRASAAGEEGNDDDHDEDQDECASMFQFSKTYHHQPQHQQSKGVDPTQPPPVPASLPPPAFKATAYAIRGANMLLRAVNHVPLQTNNDNVQLVYHTTTATTTTTTPRAATSGDTSATKSNSLSSQTATTNAFSSSSSASASASGSSSLHSSSSPSSPSSSSALLQPLPTGGELYQLVSINNMPVTLLVANQLHQQQQHRVQLVSATANQQQQQQQQQRPSNGISTTLDDDDNDFVQRLCRSGQLERGDVCAARVNASTGGKLTLDCGLSLMIPEGAIVRPPPHEQTQGQLVDYAPLVYLAVSRHLRNTHRTADSSPLAIALSDVVLIGPSDVCLAKPLVLMMDHCAHRVHVDWTLRLFADLSRSVSSPPTWTEQTNVFNDERPNANNAAGAGGLFAHCTPNHVIVMTDKLGWLSVYGESANTPAYKSHRLVIFAHINPNGTKSTTTTAGGTELTLHIYCIENTMSALFVSSSQHKMLRV